jgi:hypothetical protein
MLEQKPSHEVEGIVSRAQRQDCVSTDLGKGTKTFLLHLRAPRRQWPPSFLNGRNLELPRLFIELAAWEN